MKVFLKKLLVCIIMFILLFNFVLENQVQAAVDLADVLKGMLEVIGTVADGIVGILTWPFRLLALVAETAIMGILRCGSNSFWICK